jgi:hypothetical protein
MKLLVSKIILTLLISIKLNAQSESIYMWFNGDQNKPIHILLFATDSSEFRKDTLRAFHYIITQKEFLQIREFFLCESVAINGKFKSSGNVSFDFTLFGYDSRLMFFTANLDLVRLRLETILKILKGNPSRSAIEQRFNSLYLDLKATKIFRN